LLITESVPKPLDEIVIDYLLSQKRETAEMDFKLFINVSRHAEFAKIAKDIFAMSNYGGGYLVIGFKETTTGRFEPVGLPEDFHIEQASLQEKFNSYSNEPLALDYAEVEKEVENHKKKFAILYVPPAPVVLKPIKYATYLDEKKHRDRKLFSRDEILIRRGTQSVHASLNEIKYIERRSKQTEYRISLLSGESDTVVENLYGNFFRVIRLPEFIFEAEIPQNIRFSYSETRAKPYVRPKGSKKYTRFAL
jgi:predicted HTH transcriptional regulator